MCSKCNQRADRSLVPFTARQDVQRRYAVRYDYVLIVYCVEGRLLLAGPSINRSNFFVAGSLEWTDGSGSFTFIPPTLILSVRRSQPSQTASKMCGRSSVGNFGELVFGMNRASPKVMADDLLVPISVFPSHPRLKSLAAATSNLA